MARPDFTFGSLSASTISFKVTPEVLNQKALQLQHLITDITREFDSVASRVNSMSGYWQGEAATAHRELFNRGTQEVSETLTALNSYVTKLNTIAGNYAQTEQALQQVLTELPSDVII